MQHTLQIDCMNAHLRGVCEPVHPFVNICHLGVVLMGLSAGADLPLHLLSQDGLILSALPLLVYALYLSPALG